MQPCSGLTHWGRDIWTTSHRKYFQMHLCQHRRTKLCLDFIEVWFQRLNYRNIINHHSLLGNVWDQISKSGLYLLDMSKMGPGLCGLTVRSFIDSGVKCFTQALTEQTRDPRKHRFKCPLINTTGWEKKAAWQYWQCKKRCLSSW